jgi:hypothetical protein
MSFPAASWKGRLVRHSWLITPLLVGAWIRLHNLRWQILADDEWHAYWDAVRQSYWQLYSTFSSSAVPPLTLYYKLLHDFFGLREITLRLPMLLAGILMIAALPLSLPKTMTPAARRAFAWLLAIAPVLVYYSRYARPYNISLVLAFVAILAWYRAWQGESPRFVGLFLIAGLSACYLHLTFLPPLLFCFFWSALLLTRKGSLQTRTWRLLVKAGALFAAVFLLLLGPPLWHDWQALAGRSQTSHVDPATLHEALLMSLGQNHLVTVALMLGLALFGLWSLARQEPALLIFLSAIGAVGATATIVSGAQAIGAPIVFLRYSLLLLALLLLAVALGIGRLSEMLPSKLGSFTAPLLALILFAVGPLPSLHFRVNSWTSHAIYQYSIDDASMFSYLPGRTPRRISAFYQRLGREEEGSLIIAEAPYWIAWGNNPHPLYQAVHRQWTKATFVDSACRKSTRMLGRPEVKPGQTGFRNIVDLQKMTEIGLHGIDYVVMHKNLRDEFPGLVAGVRGQGSDIEPYASARWQRCLAALEGTLGRPGFEDQDLLVWDVRTQKTRSWTPGRGFDLSELAGAQ